MDQLDCIIHCVYSCGFSRPHTLEGQTEVFQHMMNEHSQEMKAEAEKIRARLPKKKGSA